MRSFERRSTAGKVRHARSDHRHVPIHDIEHRIAGHEGGGVSSSPRPRCEIEPGVPAMPGDDPRVCIAGPAGIVVRHRHEVEIRGRERASAQDFGEPGGVAIRVAVGRIARTRTGDPGRSGARASSMGYARHSTREEGALPGHRGTGPLGAMLASATSVSVGPAISGMGERRSRARHRRKAAMITGWLPNRVPSGALAARRQPRQPS